MNLSHLAHYKNKYPGGQVMISDTALDVFDSAGVHRVAMRKNGAGGWTDVGEQVGATDSHDLSPIPKDARVYKHYASNKVQLSEEAKARTEAASKMAVGGKILSIEEYQALGMSFHQDGSLKDNSPKSPVAAPTKA